jgi:uncharacterized membrane protein YphA (DoxX/SURF4 family)
MFRQLAHFTDLSLLLLRLMVAVVFVSSGWSHVSGPWFRGPRGIHRTLWNLEVC